MLDSAPTIAAIAVTALLLAVAAGASPLGRRQLRQLDGATVRDERYIRLSAYLLIAAVVLGGVAAITATVSRIF